MKNNLVITVLLIALVLTMGLSSAALGSNLLVSGNTEVNTGLIQTKTNADAHAVAKVNLEQKALSIDDLDDEFDGDNSVDDDLNDEDDGRDDDERDDFSSESIHEASAAVDASVKKEARESKFAQVSIGQGWAILQGDNSSEQEGFFARIFWVEKTFVNTPDTTNASGNASLNTTVETKKAIGTLKIGSNLYRLVLDSETNDTIVFDVSSKKNKINGILELEAETSLLGFTVWSGILELDSGQSYKVHVATKNSKIKSTGKAKIEVEVDDGEEKRSGLKGNINAAARGEGKKLDLWARIRAFFSGDFRSE